MKTREGGKRERGGEGGREKEREEGGRKSTPISFPPFHSNVN